MVAGFDRRRRALVRLVTAGFGAIAAGLAGLVGLAAVPRTTPAPRRWRRVASVEDLPADAPLAVVLADRHRDGWFETTRQTVLYVDRDRDGYRAWSAACTHLGCRVRWDPVSQQYLCPCHGGAYGRDGRVAAGPPPAPLASVGVRVPPDSADIEIEL